MSEVNKEKDVVVKTQDAKAVKAKVETVGVFKKYDDVQLPTKGTTSASGYDLRAHFASDEPMTIRYKDNSTGKRSIEKSLSTGNRELAVRGGERVLIPTGLILDIPDAYDVKVYPRSGISHKNGITLANCVAVIDSDYTGELLVSIINVSNETFYIKSGDRIAQMIIEEKAVIEISEIKTQPKQKGDRTGGCGSTGTK